MSGVVLVGSLEEPPEHIPEPRLDRGGANRHRLTSGAKQREDLRNAFSEVARVKWRLAVHISHPAVSDGQLEPGVYCAQNGLDQHLERFEIGPLKDTVPVAPGVID